MTLQIPGLQTIGQRAGSKLLVRQDSLKFVNFNMEIIQTAGAPVGDYEEGSMFLNTKDFKLYTSTNFKISHTPDLVWYKLNAITGTNIADFSPVTKYVGTAVGSPALTAGKYGNAVIFDGTDDKVTIDNSMPFSFSSDWDIAFWVYINEATPVNGDNVYIFQRYIDATHYFRFYIEYQAGSYAPYISYNSGGGDVEQHGNRSLPPNVWIHISISHNTSGNAITYRKNGETGGDTAVLNAPALGFTTEDFEIGKCQVDSSFGDSPMWLDDFKLWDGGRTGNENKVDSFNIDKVHWIAHSGSPVD